MGTSSIKGMKELEKMFRQLGKVPQTVATRAARSGAAVALRSAKKNAPVDLGYLRQGLVLKKKSVQGFKGKLFIKSPLMRA